MGSSTGRSLKLVGTLSLLALLVSLPLRASAYIRPGVTERVNLTMSGNQTGSAKDGDICLEAAFGHCSDGPVISGDGKFVAFWSASSRLVPNDMNAMPDAFVRDLEHGSTQLVTTSSDGLQQLCVENDLVPLRCKGSLAISRDGRYIAFVSGSPNLVVGDTNLADDVFVKDMKTSEIKRANLGVNGEEANASASWMTMSADGRFISFSSDATNVVPGDTNGATDVFVRDLVKDKTERISMGFDGAEANGPSFTGSLSPDGRFVAFTSRATNIVEGDTNTQDDVFLHDRQTGKTERVSLRTDGQQVPPLAGNSSVASGNAVSRNGRYVLFRSNTTSLVPNGGLGCHHYIRDVKLGRTERVSVRSDGTEGESYGLLGFQGCGISESLSPDGRYAFIDTAGRFVDEDGSCDDGTGASSDIDVYVYDRFTGAIDLESRSTKGNDAASGTGCTDSSGGNASDDSTEVVFRSNASNLVPDDTNGLWDIFLRHRGDALLADLGGAPGDQEPPEDEICLPLIGCVGHPDAVSREEFGPEHAGLLPVEDLVGARVAARPELGDTLFVLELRDLDLLTSIGHLYTVQFRDAQGTRYEVRASSMPHGASIGTFGLFRCDGSRCIEVSRLKGGFGTTGARIVVAMPRDLFGAGRLRLTDIVARSSLGDYLLGARLEKDVLALRPAL